ncbi:MAG: hypothetical protein C5B52_05340 [Bacteroidetes bacterium]|nr:MAG: hypothetical protein C5B52_05340 [Bacteroidota bacterium]
MALQTFFSCNAQSNFGTDHLQLIKTITLPGVKGRIDHLDVDLKDQIVYVAALGNNTCKVVDIQNEKVVHTISGLDEPQGVAYIPQQHEIFIANGGNGDCYFYNADNFEKTGTIPLGSDADDVRYDSSDKKIFVGYGSGGIAIIDAVNHKQIADVKLPGHPESFQIDKSLKRLFVNVPDAKTVAVIDLETNKLIAKWPNTKAEANFPMSLDSDRHIVFIGCRHPAKLIAKDGNTGNEIAVASLTGDSDDLYFDDQSKQIIASGGEGYISIFNTEGKAINQIANIKSRNGARTSLLISPIRVFVVAARSQSGNEAALLVYKIK